jgi:iron(III) transport system ATP-binding protein
MLDEPLSNLDAKLREQMRVEIRALQKTLGLTALYVTHDQAEAMTLSDRIGVVHRGRFEQIGTPAEVYDRPATPFVADFLGRTVAFEGTVVKNGSGFWIELRNDAGRISLASSVAETFSGGDPVRLTARPEDFEIVPDTAPDRDYFAARVDQVAYLGDHFEYQVNAGETSFALASGKKQHYEPGSLLRLRIDPHHIKVEILPR